MDSANQVQVAVHYTGEPNGCYNESRNPTSTTQYCSGVYTVSSATCVLFGWPTPSQGSPPPNPDNTVVAPFLQCTESAGSTFDCRSLNVNPGDNFQCQFDAATRTGECKQLGGPLPPTPNFTVNVVELSKTISPGVNTSYTVEITPTNGFTGTVNLAVSGCPATATCAFAAPASVNISGNSSVFKTLNITNTGSLVAGQSFTFTAQGTAGALSNSDTAVLLVDIISTPDPIADASCPSGVWTDAKNLGGSAAFPPTIISGFDPLVGGNYIVVVLLAGDGNLKGAEWAPANMTSTGLEYFRPLANVSSVPAGLLTGRPKVIYGLYPGFAQPAPPRPGLPGNISNWQIYVTSSSGMLEWLHWNTHMAWSYYNGPALDLSPTPYDNSKIGVLGPNTTRVGATNRVFRAIDKGSGSGPIFIQECQPQPTIVLTPSSFSFSGTSGGATPAAQNLNIRNNGSGPMNWTFSRSGAGTWCNLSQASGTLAGGANQNVQVTVTAPSNAGTFNNCGIIISDPTATNNPQTASITYTVSAPAGENSSCGAFTYPATVVAGQPFSASLTVNNTGSQTWRSVAVQPGVPHRLGSLDYPTWSIGRVDLPANTVNAGASATFNFNLTATSTLGVHPFRWQMLQEGVQWFGAVCSGNITVVAPSFSYTATPAALNFTAAAGGPNPAAQNISLANTGNQALNITASEAIVWADLGSSSWSLNPTQSGTSAVSINTTGIGVGNYSGAVNFANSQGAGNKTVTLNYTITPNNPGCVGAGCGGGGGSEGGGVGSPVTATNSTCGRIDLSWQAGTGATSYNVYRNTVNASSTAALIANVAGTTHNDTTVTPGVNYFYWVRSMAAGIPGPHLVGAASNGSGGIAASACPPAPPTGGTVNNNLTDNTVACGTLRFTWTDNSTNETSFRLFRSSSNAFPGAAGLIATVNSTTGAGTGSSYSYVYNLGTDENVYYYWVTSYYAAGGDSPPTAFGSIANVPCKAQLSNSNKVAVRYNGSAIPAASAPVCDGSVPLPSFIAPQVGDNLTFALHICNTDGSAAASSITITDTLTNLRAPLTSAGALVNPASPYSVKYGSDLATAANLTYQGTGCNPTPGRYCISGTVPNQRLDVNLSSAAYDIPIGGRRTLFLDGQLAVPSGFTGSKSFFQNFARIDFFDSVSNSFRNVFTPLQQFLVQIGTPVIRERP